MHMNATTVALRRASNAHSGIPTERNAINPIDSSDMDVRALAGLAAAKANTSIANHKGNRDCFIFALLIWRNGPLPGQELARMARDRCRRPGHSVVTPAKTSFEAMASAFVAWIS